MYRCKLMQVICILTATKFVHIYSLIKKVGKKLKQKCLKKRISIIVLKKKFKKRITYSKITLI